MIVISLLLLSPAVSLKKTVLWWFLIWMIILCFRVAFLGIDWRLISCWCACTMNVKLNLTGNGDRFLLSCVHTHNIVQPKTEGPSPWSTYTLLYCKYNTAVSYLWPSQALLFQSMTNPIALPELTSDGTKLITPFPQRLYRCPVHGIFLDFFILSLSRVLYCVIPKLLTAEQV